MNLRAKAANEETAIADELAWRNQKLIELKELTMALNEVPKQVEQALNLFKRQSMLP